MSRKMFEEPPEVHLRRAIENGLHEAEHKHGLCWIGSAPDARRRAAEVIVRHIGTQPWTTTPQPHPAGLVLGYAIAATLGAAALLAAIAIARVTLRWAIG